MYQPASKQLEMDINAVNIDVGTVSGVKTKNAPPLEPVQPKRRAGTRLASHSLEQVTHSHTLLICLYCFMNVLH